MFWLSRLRDCRLSRALLHSRAVWLVLRRLLFLAEVVVLLSIWLQSAGCASEAVEPSYGDPAIPAPPSSSGDPSSASSPNSPDLNSPGNPALPGDPTSPEDPTSLPPPNQLLPTLAATRLVVDGAFATAPLCANCHASLQGLFAALPRCATQVFAVLLFGTVWQADAPTARDAAEPLRAVDIGIASGRADTIRKATACDAQTALAVRLGVTGVTVAVTNRPLLTERIVRSAT